MSALAAKRCSARWPRHRLGRITHPVVPKCNGVRLPMEADLEVDVLTETGGACQRSRHKDGERK